MQHTILRLLLSGSGVMFVLALLAPIAALGPVSQAQREPVAAGATTPPVTSYAYLKQVKLENLIYPPLGMKDVGNNLYVQMIVIEDDVPLLGDEKHSH